MNALTFRPATESDLDTISALASRIWKIWYPRVISMEQVDYMLARMYSPASLAEQMTAKNHQFALAYLDGELIGYASVSTTDGKQYFLHKFYVDTTLHRRGIGAAFLQYLESMYSPEVMRLTVNRKNFTSINFYFKNGFLIESVEDFNIGDGYFMNDFVMLKQYV